MDQLPVSALAYDNAGCHDHQFLQLRHQDQCLIITKTQNIALKLSKFTKNEII